MKNKKKDTEGREGLAHVLPLGLGRAELTRREPPDGPFLHYSASHRLLRTVRERERVSLSYFFPPSSSSTFPSASSFDSSISPEPTLRCVGFFFFSPFLRENENLHLLPFSTLFIFLISFFLSSIPPSFFSDFHILTMIIFIFTSWQTHTWPQAGSTPPTTRVPHLFPSEISNNTSHEVGKTFPQSEMETIERSEGGPKKGANQSGQSTGWAHWFKEKGSRNYISAPPLQ